jgi:hypothetical protein
MISILFRRNSRETLAHEGEMSTQLSHLHVAAALPVDNRSHLSDNISHPSASTMSHQWPADRVCGACPQLLTTTLTLRGPAAIVSHHCSHFLSLRAPFFSPSMDKITHLWLTISHLSPLSV